MLNLNDRKLLFMIKYTPVIVVGIFMVIINVIIFNTNRIEGTERLNALFENAITQKNETIREEIDRVFHHLENQQQSTRNKLKQQAKQRVEEAHAIALNIYNNNREKSKLEVATLISDALRMIRFFEGRGYFFIYQMDGINVLHSLRPDLEGLSQWNIQDVRGSYILREHIHLIESQGGEAFYQWWYPKTGEPIEKEFEKIGFGKYFAPYDWFIGTGEYLGDVEHDIQQEALTSIQNYRYSQDGYIFILDKDDRLIAHPDPKLINQVATPSLTDAIHRVMDNESISSGFVEYNARYMPGALEGGRKISYVAKIKQWDWTIGTGFYIDQFELYIEEQRKVLKQNLQKRTTNIVLLSSLCTMLTMLVSLFVGRIIAMRFSLYQERITHDFTELEKTKNSLQYLALHDPLTQLPNRSWLQTTISEQISFCHDQQHYLAIAFVDLDNFKKINDLYGHTSGDKLLSILSRKFETLLDQHDSVARFGGDEFIFCFSNLSDLATIETKALAIRHTFGDHFVIEGKIITSSCSIGISVFPTDGDSVEALIRKADIALNMAKSELKGSIRYYDHQVDSKIEWHYALEEQLKKALIRNEFSIVYQPQIDVASGKMVGVEALARWHNPKLGHIAPDTFIYIAEETGLIEEIGLWIFRTACYDINLLSPNGAEAINLSINISPKQLIDQQLPEKLYAITKEIGIKSSRITLEITENVLLDDVEKVTPMLHQFRNFGFGLSLDDFGTGYSSLSYLNLLPITEIKIDRCFVDRLPSTKQSISLIKSILAIGKSCNMLVVAEGVETQQQFEALEKYGCKLVQGYFFDRPLRLKELSDRMNKNRSHQFHG
jgi:diguanylate cyclase (GGDEF)-like protein